jgi:hypothetical protein
MSGTVVNQTVTEIQKPRTDERIIWDLLSGVIGHQVLLVAQSLKIFPTLGEKPRTLVELCNALNLEQRATEAMLSVLASLQLVQLDDNVYSLTPFSEDYLLESSPTYLGTLLDSMSSEKQQNLLSFERLKKTMLGNKPNQIFHGDKFVKFVSKNAKIARIITRSIHGQSLAASLGWTECIDLSNYRRMLDIGGGSGAHSIGAASKWPNLQSTILDLPAVCNAAQEYIEQHSLQSRIITQAFNMWSDPLPAGDLHFFSAVYHDWSPEKCQFLTQKSFDSLPSGGRLIIHELLFNDQKTGPYPVAAQNFSGLLVLGGQQYAGYELALMLAEAGFTDIEVKPTWSYWSIVTGCKP